VNFRRVARLLAGFALFFALVQAVPLAAALLEAGAGATASAFGGSAGIGLAVAGLLRLAGRGASAEFHRRESLAVVGFAWGLAGLLGAIPFVWSGALPSGVDALFETLSGLTTTGASVFGSGGNAPVSALPKSILLWRALLHFFGGVGIILIFIVLLPAMGVTGKNLLISEQVGVSTELGQPRMRDQARTLFRCYLTLVGLCALSYWLAGMQPFDAFCHACATLSSGGFSTQDHSLAEYQSLGIELAGTFFMFCAGCNFAWFVSLARNPRESTRVLASPELRAFATIAVGMVVIATLALFAWGGRVDDFGAVRDYGDFGRCARDASFNVMSMLTCTGFATANFNCWPQLTILVLLLCPIIGGCTGSTSGGLKILRVLVCARLAALHVGRFVRPKSVSRLRVGEDVVPDPIVSGVLAVLVLWLMTVVVGAAVLATDSRLDLLSCVSTSISMLGCTGPGITTVQATADGGFAIGNAAGIDIGAFGGYGALTSAGKLWCALQMVLGRLEILAPLVLFLPGFWRR
jgi:trk system potassium uptake protein TrkH